MEIEITEKMQSELRDHLYNMIIADNPDKSELDNELSNELFDSCTNLVFGGVEGEIVL